MDGKRYQRSGTRPAGKRILNRPRVNEVFKKAVEKPVVFVSAGMGYGKTQAVSSFIAGMDFRCIWMNLYKLDNLPSLFWETFVYGISQEDAALGDALLKLGFPDTFDKYNRFLILFSRFIYSERHLAIVFDDIHVLTESRISTFIRQLIEERFENTSIFLLSKTDDLPVLSDVLRIGHTARIGWEELMFRLDEIKELLKLWEIDVEDRLLEEVWRRTEGWPLMVPLLADPAKAAGRITGRSLSVLKPVLDYFFEEEAFTWYDLDIKKLLVKLSLLDSFDMTIVQTLGQALPVDLKEIVSHNMFIQYNSYLNSFLFHNLYKAFLSDRLYLLTEAEQAGVYRAVAQLYEKRRLFMDALKYYHFSGGYDRIWKIIRKQELNCSVETGTFYLTLLADIPAAMKKQEPLIEIVTARLLLNGGRIAAADEKIQAVLSGTGEGVAAGEWQAALGEAYLIDGWLKLIRRDYAYEESFRRGAKFLPAGSRFVSENLLSVNACYSIAPTSGAKGELDTFMKRYIRMLPHYITLLRGCGYGQAELLLAEAAYFRNRMDEAASYGLKAVSCGRSKNQEDIVALAYNILLFASIAGGRYQEAVSYLKQLERDVPKAGKAGWIRDIVEGSLYSKLGRADLVADWIMGEGANTTVIPVNDDGRHYYIRAYCYLETGRYAELGAYIEFLEDYYGRRPAKSLPVHINLQVLKAVACFKLNQMEGAAAAFKRAYDLACGNDLTMFFIEYGSYMRSLINSLRRQDDIAIPKEWMDNICSKATTYAKKLNGVKSRFDNRSHEGGSSGLLTDRERDILLCLSQGLTREEIAAEKDISINTVKSDLRTIYNKLGAINRKDAVRIAAIRGIL